MPALPELQRRFAGFVFGRAEPGGWSDLIEANGLTPEQRLGIYRNNTRLGLTEALAATYPVVARLVGRKFFNGLARHYIERHPPETSSLIWYGDHFAAFVNGFAGCASLPYLPDVARLERLQQEAFHEADQARFDFSRLAAVAPEHYGKLCFRCHASMRLLTSRYPVYDIWRANQDGCDAGETIRLDRGGSAILVFRPDLEVLTRALTGGQYLFLSRLQAGEPLLETARRTNRPGRRFDLAGELGFWADAGLITDFTISGG